VLNNFSSSFIIGIERIPIFSGNALCYNAYFLFEDFSDRQGISENYFVFLAFVNTRKILEK
jgi:hypothetical protein